MHKYCFREHFAWILSPRAHLRLIAVPSPRSILFLAFPKNISDAQKQSGHISMFSD